MDAASFLQVNTIISFLLGMVAFAFGTAAGVGLGNGCANYRVGKLFVDWRGGVIGGAYGTRASCPASRTRSKPGKFSVDERNGTKWSPALLERLCDAGLFHVLSAIG
jgi:Na+-transporting methylmalonyl-CoA/oxaloacetate decarboxylase beta subunit